MLTFILAFGLIATIIAAMAIGVILQNKPIKGSCGGIAALGMDTECEICGGDPAKCDESDPLIENAGVSGEALFYEASRKKSADEVIKKM